MALRVRGFTAAVLATSLAVAPAAYADRWYGEHPGHHGGGGNAAAAIIGGIVGLGVGAAIASGGGYYPPPPW